ncbi:hypothetical protein, partial [Demequina sp.]|uniref:LppM family (lipo)protein n=1 Tax=Demequina sp. TaxID=2050685 RepID=UPI0025FFCBA8
MRKALGVAALALVLLLSGCMKFDARLTLGPDNTVDGSYVFAVREGSGAALGVSDREAAEQLYAESGLSDGLQASRQHGWSGDGFVGTEVTFRNQPLEDFAPTSERFGVTREGDEYLVKGRVSAITAENADALEDAELTVSVTFPGPIARTNGEVDGTTVTWNLVGGPEQLYARGSAVRATSPLPGILT